MQFTGSSLNLVPEVCVQDFLGDLVWVVMDTADKFGRKRKHSSAFKTISKSEVETRFVKLNVMS